MAGDTNLKADFYYANSTARIADQANVPGGATAEDCATANRYVRSSTGWVQISIGGAARIVPIGGYSGPRNATSPAANKMTITVASQQSGVLTGTLIHFWADTLCYVAVGTAPTAAIATSYAVPPNTVIPIPIIDQDKIAVIGSAGVAYFHPVVGDV